jgi:hypothetical protein
MSKAAPRQRRILWANVITVISAAILIGTVVVGTGLATGWAIAGMIGLEGAASYAVEAIFVIATAAFVVAFVRMAMRVEPFVER